MAKRTGRPPSKPGGLPIVMYLRAGPELRDALQARAEEERKRRPGATISLASVAREILYRALKIDGAQHG